VCGFFFWKKIDYTAGMKRTYAAALLAIFVGYLGLLGGVLWFAKHRQKPHAQQQQAQVGVSPRAQILQTVVPVPSSAPPLPVLDLATIFSSSSLDVSALDPTHITRLLATGDVIPAREVNRAMVLAHNFFTPLSQVREYVRGADISLIDLESPLLKTGCPIIREGFTFCGQAGFADALVDAGVDVVNLPNNHIGNFGLDGIAQTERVLDERGLAWDGFGTVATKKVHDVTFGFMGWNAVGAPVDRTKIAHDVAEAKKHVDVLVVSMHWGKEYVATPSSAAGIAPDDPRELGRLLVDAGADLVIGNHPHWAQGVEMYRDKLITYAHGNFMFDQNWSQETQEGVVGEYTFYDHVLVGVHFQPIQIGKNFGPSLLDADRGAHIISQMKKSTDEMLASPILP